MAAPALIVPDGQIALFELPPVLVPITPSKESDEFYTPPDVLGMLPHIDLDPFHSAHSMIVDRGAVGRVQRPDGWVYADETFDLQRGQDALQLDWGRRVQDGIVFGNPPYSRTAESVAKMRQESDPATSSCMVGLDIVGLINAFPGEGYWHEHIWPHALVGFFRGRLRFWIEGFVPAENTARAGSAFVVYGPNRMAMRAHIARKAGDRVRWVDTATPL